MAPWFVCHLGLIAMGSILVKSACFTTAFELSVDVSFNLFFVELCILYEWWLLCRLLVLLFKCGLF